MIPRNKKNSIAGYKNLGKLKEKLKQLLIRRKKEEVLKELDSIIDEIVVQNQRKMVIFSEWTTMTFLIARHLSDMGIPFVELSGKIPVKKRHALIDEFTNNPDCLVFLSTDAGGTGLNLQAADCVVNFELPWNPAKMNQRIGWVSRIGQASQCINVINLVAKNSIEERILAGIQPDNIQPDNIQPENASAEKILASQPPEKIETVLNSGMDFIAGLMEMATGQKIEKGPGQKKMIEIDNRTGEVTLKFKLPGF